jgi:hypothetical protein
LDKFNSQWVSSAQMAQLLGVHKQTLLTLRRSRLSPFREGIDFRWSGLTTNGSLQWHSEKAEAAFCGFRRVPSAALLARAGQ